MATIYISHRDSLPTTSPHEGRVYPLLRRRGDNQLSLAFAVPKPSNTGSVAERRKNRLVHAVLKALGFERDDSPNPNYSGFDFLYLEGESLIPSYATSVFDAATLPDLSGDPADLEVRIPVGGTLKLKDGEETKKDIKGAAIVGVDRFQFKSGAEGHFELRGAGAETHPFFIARLTLEDRLKQEFPSGTAPELTIEHDGVDGIPRCNNVSVVASGSSHNSAGAVVATISGDTRHDRLTVDVATLVCLEPDTSDPKLAIEVFPAISFQPVVTLPVTISVSNDGVCLRLQPRSSAEPPKMTLNRFRPCVRVTIRGPVIHADASATAALEALRLLEPAERKLEETVEHINDFLVYSFEVCLPQSDVVNLRLEDLDRLDGVLLPLTNWPDVGGVDPRKLGQFFGSLSEFFSRLEGLLQPLIVTFPNVGLPSITEYDFAKFEVVLCDRITVQYPDINLAPILGELKDLPSLWSVRLLRPQKPDLELKVKLLTVDQVKVTFQFEDIDLGTLGISASARLRVNWNIKIKPPSLATNILELTTDLPTVRLPKTDGDWDIGLLKVRARVGGVDKGTFAIKNLDGKKIELDIPKVGATFPDMKVFDGASIEFALDLTLPLTKCFLSDLLGDLGSVDFRLSVPQPPKAIDFAEIGAAFGDLATPIIPLELVVRVPHPTKPKLKWDELQLVLGMRFDLSTFRLLDNRIYFFLPQRRALGESNQAPRQVMDFDIFTLTFPNRPEPLGFPTVENHDGYLDLTSREFVVDLRYPEPLKPTPAPRIHAFFPGGLDANAARLGREGVENLGNEDVNYKKYRREYAKRFDLELDEVDPKLWPNTGPERLMFRFNSNGLTFAANLGKTEVEIDSSGFSDDGKSDGNSAGLIKPFKCQPQEKQRELRSRLVIIDNELKEAGVYAKTEVPGVEKLMAEISVVLRQRQKGMLPEVLASMELERADEAPLAEFSIKLLEMSLDRLELGLIWRMQEKEWDYSIIADGTIAFTGAAALVPDLEGLRAPSIQVVGLDLRRMNLRQLRVPFTLVRPVRFDILDGLFGVELGDLEIGWEFDGKVPKPRLLACELATLTFKNPGALEVSVSVGGLHIEFDPDLKAHVKLPSSLGIEVALGTSAKFGGRVGWVETVIERYLFAEGNLLLEGLPEVRGLLKFGTGEKFSGRREINLVLYGEMDLDEQLFSGAVVKSLGLGVGLNNRLAAMPPSPSADAILRRIDLVKPGKVEGWQFVREGGFYMSVIGSVTLASNLGEPDVLNAYVAALVVSIDTNFDLVAAGKCWLSCSVKGQRANPNNPAFVGAMVLSPRQRKLEVVLESRKNPYVEQNDLIKKLLDKGFVRFAFRMTPQIVDYHLAELSYRDQMFGAQMEFRGEYRFAIFKRAVLLKNELSATGSISKSLSGGAGGFDLDGQAYLRLGYGGLLSDRGAMAYAFIEAGIRFRVSAWIEIGFSISIRICGKRYTKSWSVVFRTRVPQLELTFRGHIAVADRGGLGGFDLLVGINVPICGYRLNVTTGWAVNADLYQEVRSVVAAFEAELEAAVNALDKSTSGPSFAPMAFALHGSAAALEAAAASAPVSPPFELWLLYSREMGNETVSLLLPAPDGRWLTPTMATVKQIEVADNKATFDIGQSIDGLPTTANVRLVGLRGSDIPTDKISRSWPAEIRGRTVMLTVAEIPRDKYNLLAGVWYIEETVSGLASQEHDTVPYLNEVERAVVRTDRAWLTIQTVDGTKITTTSPHNISGEVRILLRNGNEVQDPGETRKYGPSDVANLTVKAKRVDDHQLELTELGSIAPAPGWQLATAIEIAPPWSARNRLAALREYARDESLGIDQAMRAGFDQNTYRDYTGAAAAWAETAATADAGETVASTASYAVVFDERYTSADPRFSPADAPVEPGVLATRFRPIDDVEAVGVDTVLEAARRFEEASRSVARQQMHGAFDLDNGEAIQQARAQATQLLVHRLSDPRGLETNDRLEAPVAEHQRDKVTYGWFCKSDQATWQSVMDAIGANGSDDVLFVRRAGSQAKAVTLKLPDNTGTNESNRPTPLPIRQDFVIDEASEVRERGRVIVRLPIRYPDDVLRHRPHDIGRLQVYRRIGDGPEELVFDHLRPDVTQLDKKQVYSKSRQQFVDYPRQPRDAEDSELPGTFDQSTRKLFIANPLAALLPTPSQPIAAEPLDDLTCRVDDKEFVITDVSRDNSGIQLTLASTNDLVTGPVTVLLIANGLIVPRPVLISDEFAVTDRQFDSSELRAAAGSGRAPSVQYSLVALSEDDTGGAKPASQYPRIPWPTAVPLFIPKPKEPLPNLALAIPVGSLLQLSTHGVTFQLVDLSEETPKLAERSGRPLSAEDLEFWLDADILRQSGFYAGESADPNPPREGDGERITLAAVNSTDGFESTAGKMRIGAESVPNTAYYKFTETALSPGAAFRAFFRPKGDTSVRSLRRLPILLVREFPRTWDSTVRYRLIDTAEIIPDAHKASVQKGEAIPHLMDFSADDRYEAGRAAIRSVWPSLTLLEGGVELQFRDFDDSSMRSRTLVEVLEAGEFPKSQNDFRDDTFWSPRPPDRVERYVSRIVSTAESADLKAAYLWKRPKPDGNGVEDEIDVIRRLGMAKDKLGTATSWSEYANAVKAAQTALLSFEKSPLNLNSVQLRQWIELLRLTLRCVIVGNGSGLALADIREWADRTGPPPLVVPGPLLTKAKTRYQELLSHLVQIEQLRADTVSDTDGASTAFLDRDTARKLAGIARRRVAIADDATALRDIDTIPQTRSMIDGKNGDTTNVDLARRKEWNHLYDDANSLAAEMKQPIPITQSLQARFGDTARSDAVTLCVRMIERIVYDIGHLPLEELVPRAAGLSELLYWLNENIRNNKDDTPAGLLKRPHHELTTTRKEDGEIVPREVPVRDFLPPRARQAKLGTIPQEPDERLERLGIRAGHVATLFGNEDVAIWTTRGDSVHAEPMERVQYFATGATKPLHAFELSEVAEGPRLLIAATFNGMADVQLWDAGEARELRKYGNGVGATFAHTPRGPEVAIVFGGNILLETTEAPKPLDPARELIFKLTQDVLERLSKFYYVPEPIIHTLGQLKDQEFPTETEFLAKLAELEGHDRVRPYLQVVINQAQNPIAMRSPLAFMDVDKPDPFDGPVAYHDEIHILAAARGSEILFWRDLGRPENKTPFLTFDLKLGAAATHIQPVTLPSGAGFVVASTDSDKGLFFVDPLSRQVDAQRQPKPTVIDQTAIAVTQLAVDRRELRASAITGNKLHSYDLLQLKPWEATPNAKCVVVLHGRHDGKDMSYSAYTADNTVLISSLKENFADPDMDPRQTLPVPDGLGTTPPVEIVAMASALQTARMATAAGDPLSLFHFWERMGFAVDIAAQDETTRLLSLEELREKIDAAIGAMTTEYKDSHLIYRVEGEEPDAEFRVNDRVGFSHINVAVLPSEFLAACLAPNVFDPQEEFLLLRKWLKNRSIGLAHDMDSVVIKQTDTEEVKRQKQENRRELEYVVHMTRLVGVPLPSRFGTVVGKSPKAGVPRGGELHVQPRSERFVRVPASVGFSHWSWTLPDRKGHRMLVAARRVSRYEPLLRWWLNLHTRFDLAEEVALRRLGSNDTVHSVAAPVSDVAVTLGSALEPSTGWQPLRVEIVEGPGTGQRREVVTINAGTLQFDQGDPLLVDLVADQSKCRVLDAAPGWRLVVIDAVHDPARGEGAKPLMVYQYPHSRKPRFSYQIPLDGMRATYNQISRVRTGYHGIEAAFRYYLPERIDNPEAKPLGDLLNAIETSAQTPAAPERIVTTAAGGAEPDVRLFRHERMVSLPGLPFFYRYRLDFRSAYKARQLEWDRSTAAERLPDDENASPSAQRLPACLGLNVMQLRPLLLSGRLPASQPTDKKKVRLYASGSKPFTAESKLRVRQSQTSAWIEKQGTGWNDGVLTVDAEYADQPAEDWEYELEPASTFEAVLYLSANRDHLTREEARSEPDSVTVPVNGDEVHARDLPDFFMDYLLYRLQQSGEEPLRSLGDLFSVVGTIRMPWSPDFRVPTSFPGQSEAMKKPFVSVASGVKLVKLAGGGPPTEAGREDSIAIQRVVVNGSPYWQLRFGIANEPGQTILTEGEVFIQATRDGKLTRAVPCANGGDSTH